MTDDSQKPVQDAPVGAEIPVKPEVPSWRLVLTLAVAGAVAATLLSVVYALTLPAIEANKARVLEEAIGIVLKDAARVVSLQNTESGLVEEPAVVYAVDTKTQNRVFLGYDEAGKPVGFALVNDAYGYGSDPIKLIFGFEPIQGEIIGLQVLEHKETPGIGTKIEDDVTFAGLFRPGTLENTPPRQPRLVGKRDDQYLPSDPHQVDMISGATISSKAVIRIVNEALEKVGDKIRAWKPGETR